jgi:hypothetical protein
MNSYLGFNPKVILDTINTKLKESSVFTGQDYTGSNFTALNDSLSWVVSMLLYYLHRTSSNTTLETNDYRSINKISNIHGYKPRGTLACSVPLYLITDNLQSGTHLIPRYSKVGRYSVIEDFIVSGNSGLLENEITVYEGNVFQHPSIYAKGNSFEKMIINAPQFVDHNFFHVYVKETNGRWYEYKETDFVVLNKLNDKVYEKRLNEDLNYEITFGDGINGRKLSKGEEIVIFYLKPSGKSGEIVINSINNVFIKYSSPKYNEIMNSISPNVADSSVVTLLRGFNNRESTKFSEPETTIQIKKNLPNWITRRRGLFKKQDFQDRIFEKYPNIVKDCKVLTNDEYIDSFLKYYYDLGILNPTELQRPMLSQVYWADSCNYNNLYIVILPRSSDPASFLLPAQGKIIKNDLQQLCGTQEIVILDPIFLEMYFGRTNDTNGNIILEREINSFRSDNSIIEEAYNIINRSIGSDATILGPNIKLDILTSLLTSIQGVKNVYTETNDGNITPGLSLILINPLYKTDTRTVTQNIKLDNSFVPFLNSTYSYKNNIIVRESQQIIKRPVF